MEYPCHLTLGGSRHEATLKQLSLGGAQVTVPPESPENAAEVGGRIELEFQPPDATEPLRLGAEIMHVYQHPKGPRVGVQFDTLTETQRTVLTAFLGEALGKPGGGAREHPRVIRRVNVTCDSADETRAVMCDLSQGGLGLETPEPVSVDEQVTVTVRLGGFPKPLQLEGTVVHVRKLDSGMYHAGVRFEQLAPDRKGVLRDLIQFLVEEPGHDPD
jgi:Tfp pilus assembly protein PilZ